MCAMSALCQVIDMPEHHPGDMGGTMRLGKRRTVFKDKDCLTSKCSYTSLSFISNLATTTNSLLEMVS